jgi:hypothetical protein
MVLEIAAVLKQEVATSSCYMATEIQGRLAISKKQTHVAWQRFKAPLWETENFFCGF